MNIPPFHILRIFFWLLLVSCHSAPEATTHTLSVVEACLESAHPDSAYHLLTHISAPETLKGEAQAHYCLLMTKTRDQMHQMHLMYPMHPMYQMLPMHQMPESDSLISIATRYYESQDADRIKKGESLFYYGRVLRKLNRPEEAMRYCLEAERVLSDSQEYELQGMIQEDMGTINEAMGLYEESMENHKRSKYFYESVSEYAGVSVALRNIGRAHLKLNSYSDSAYWYHIKALQVAREYGCSSEYSILQGLGVIFRSKNEYDKAIAYMLQARKLCVENDAIADVHFSLGYTYLKKGDWKQAEEYLKRSLPNAVDKIRVESYHCLYNIEKIKGNLLAAMNYKEKSDSIKEMLQNTETVTSIADLQKKYKNENLQNEILQMKSNYEVVLSICVVVFLIMVFLITFSTYRNWTARKRIREINQAVFANQEQITAYQDMIVSYNSLRYESEEYLSKVSELNGRVMALHAQNRELQEQLNASNSKKKNRATHGMLLSPEEHQVDSFRLMALLKNGTKRELTPEDWNHLFGLLNYIFHDFVTRLSTEYPTLTTHDIKICCLLKISIPHDDISRLFSTTPDSLTRAKGRMKKKLNFPASYKLDKFISNF